MKRVLLITGVVFLLLLLHDTSYPFSGCRSDNFHLKHRAQPGWFQAPAV